MTTPRAQRALSQASAFPASTVFWRSLADWWLAAKHTSVAVVGDDPHPKLEHIWHSINIYQHISTYINIIIINIYQHIIYMQYICYNIIYTSLSIPVIECEHCSDAEFHQGPKGWHWTIGLRLTGYQIRTCMIQTSMSLTQVYLGEIFGNNPAVETMRCINPAPVRLDLCFSFRPRRTRHCLQPAEQVGHSLPAKWHCWLVSLNRFSVNTTDECSPPWSMTQSMV